MSEAIAPYFTPPSDSLQGTGTPSTKLEKARMELLDLSARNRLLNIPRNSATSKIIQIVDEKTAEIYRLLVAENRPFTFLPGRASVSSGEVQGDTDELAELAQPDNTVDERGVFNRHTDTKFQTKLTSKGLQKRLLDLCLDARTLEEEQGVNILYLALGTLKWVNPTNVNNVRYAPLVLVPVALERGNAAEQFKLRWRQEDISSNLSLEAFLARVHNIKLPSFEISDEFDAAAYIAEVAQAVQSKTDWEVNQDDIVLGFFSFAKFLMYRDLDPAVWPGDAGLIDHPLIKGLLADGFADASSSIPDNESIDEHIHSSELLHIVDCDSSQTLAVHDVRKGRNLIIQGPPGTGKSQTIANVIAAAIADGKTVLFVAEKMAALEVVKRRLDQAGVGDAVLELHSNKANKRILLNELRRTSELGAPKGDFPATLNERLQRARLSLNQHAQRMHSRHPAAGMTPFEVIGQLAQSSYNRVSPFSGLIGRPETWSPDQRHVCFELIAELAQRIHEIGIPAKHPWRGVGLTTVFPSEVERLVQKISALKGQLDAIHEAQTHLAGILDLPIPTSLENRSLLAESAAAIMLAPTVSGRALCSTVWETNTSEINNLLEMGAQYWNIHAEINHKLTPHAWTHDVKDLRNALRSLPETFGADACLRVDTLSRKLPALITEVGVLAAHLGKGVESITLADVARAILTAQRVAAAPDASSDAFAAVVWDHGVEQAAELVAMISEVHVIQAELGVKVSDQAWETNLAQARTTIAMKGSSLLRFFDKDWRAANALVRSFLKNPDLGIPEKIDILDKLTSGQKKIALIRQEDVFGRAAFGTDWRAERSATQPLLALVEWMRSLRGLGAEPRLIASRLPNRSALGQRATHLKTLVDDVSPLLQLFWSDCGELVRASQPDVVAIDTLSLTELTSTLTSLNSTLNDCSHFLSPSNLAVGEIIPIFDRLATGQRLARAIENEDELGSSAFCELWDSPRSNWPKLAEVAKWITNHPAFRFTVAHNQDRAAPAQEAEALDAEASRYVAKAEALLGDLHASASTIFGVEHIVQVATLSVLEKLQQWIDTYEQLSKWVSYCDRFENSKTLGLSAFTEAMASGDIDPQNAPAIFKTTYFVALFTDQVRLDPLLGRFDGHLHNQLVREFSELDQQRIRSSALQVAQAHHRRIPQGGGGVGPLGVLRGEMARRRGHMPIRQLILKAAPAIQALKPVLMMSPLSVAQFLTPGSLSFDLLVMDEASQIQPVDALGAIARCRQVVVVGDERQLPPTKFFSKMTASQDDEGVDEDDGAQVADIESILGLFTARGLPQRMLRWHYRSRHESLIAVSNSQFYENKLFIVPSPYTKEAGMGLQFHKVSGGVFDSGNTKTNLEEAKVVADAIIQHALHTPQDTLGVATFSVSQRKAIQDQLEVRRRTTPEAEAFFQSHPSEPFFIKNLENVQGDERDVILISVGYGRNPQGYMAMRFGPLSAEGGERRLNVLISRAKRRCVVYASITDEDIDLERGKGKGVQSFKLFLHYARTGRLGIASQSDRAPDSTFEIQVATALQEKGFQIHPQVGIAGFFIDLAVADQSRPGRYLLGIECDGASYHSSTSARDRDRLRQAVLEDHGWIIHRIWSTDWFQRPQEELQRAIAAIKAAIAELDAREALSGVTGVCFLHDEIALERAEVATSHVNLLSESQAPNAYIEALPAKPGGAQDLHDTPIDVLLDLIECVVDIEGPVHVDEVIIRLRNAWGLKRAGSRIQAAVEQGVEVGIRQKLLTRTERFLTTERSTVRVRDRSAVMSEGLRKPDMLPPLEIEMAVLETVTRNFGASAEEVVLSVSRMIGFRSTSAQLRDLIQAVIGKMIDNAQLMSNGAILTMPATSALAVQAER